MKPVFFAFLCALVAVQGDRAAASPPEPTQLSVHTGPGCAGRAALPAFERFLGRKVDHVVDALDQRSWAQLTASIDWTSRCWKGAGVGLTLSVPMLPFGTTDTLREGVSGAFDDVFIRTGRALVRDGHADAVVRIGWEFNGDWMPWRADRDPAAYRDYFRHIVQVMRKTPGQHFRFEWCPNIGKHALAPDLAYPGDDVVDIIGLDVYNDVFSATLSNPTVRFAWNRNQPYGLTWHRQFAESHHKPTAFSEWGTSVRADGKGGGDDPVFVNGMAAWFREAPPLYQSWWEIRNGVGDDTIASGSNPRAGAAYRAAFGPGAKTESR